jgi:hypothetical protein
MVSVLRVLARTRSLYGAGDQLDSRCSYRRGDRVKRRTFITLLGAAAAWPVAVRAQQAERMRQIGVLMGYAESDSDAPDAVGGFSTTIR